MELDHRPKRETSRPAAPPPRRPAPQRELLLLVFSRKHLSKLHQCRSSLTAFHVEGGDAMQGPAQLCLVRILISHGFLLWDLGQVT